MKKTGYSVAENALFNTIGTLVYCLLQWAVTMAAVRLTTDENVGILQLAMTVTNLFVALANYNMRAFQISDLRGEYTSGEYVASRLVTCGGAAVCCALYCVIWGYSPLYTACVLAYLVYRFNESLTDVLHGVDQRFGRMDHVAVSGILRGVGMTAVFALVLSLTGSLLPAIAAMAAVTLAVAVLYDIPAARRYDGIRPRFDRRKIGALLLRCLPVMLSSVAFSAIVTLPRQILEAETDAVTLGYYATVATPLVFIQVLVNSLVCPVMTPVSDAWDRGSLPELRRIFGRMALLFLAASLVTFGGAAAVGEWLYVLLYGEKIRSYTYLMYWIAACAILCSVCGLMTNILIVMRKMKTSLVLSGTALLSGVAVTLPLIRRWGPDGVSMAIALAYVIFAAAGVIIIRREIRKNVRRPEEQNGAV